MITHDENFVNLIGRSEYATHYYRVDKVCGHTHDDTYDGTAASTGPLAPLHGSIRPRPPPTRAQPPMNHPSQAFDDGEAPYSVIKKESIVTFG